jgi:hypothetical protein
MLVKLLVHIFGKFSSIKVSVGFKPCPGCAGLSLYMNRAFSGIHL